MIITPQGQQKLAPEDSFSGARGHTLGVRAGGWLKAEAFGRDPQERVSNKSLTWGNDNQAWNVHVGGGGKPSQDWSLGDHDLGFEKEQEKSKLSLSLALEA